jgi:hypothetical protein
MFFFSYVNKSTQLPKKKKKEGREKTLHAYANRRARSFNIEEFLNGAKLVWFEKIKTAADCWFFNT